MYKDWTAIGISFVKAIRLRLQLHFGMLYISLLIPPNVGTRTGTMSRYCRVASAFNSHVERNSLVLCTLAHATRGGPAE